MTGGSGFAGTRPPYAYRPEILEQLARHGVQPRPTTPPQLVFDFVNDLYRYELRRLRARLVRREIPKEGYYDRVVELRRKYPLVAVKPHLWTEGPTRRSAPTT